MAWCLKDPLFCVAVQVENWKKRWCDSGIGFPLNLAPGGSSPPRGLGHASESIRQTLCQAPPQLVPLSRRSCWCCPSLLASLPSYNRMWSFFFLVLTFSTKPRFRAGRGVVSAPDCLRQLASSQGSLVTQVQLKMLAGHRRTSDPASFKELTNLLAEAAKEGLEQALQSCELISIHSGRYGGYITFLLVGSSYNS
ncbi:hypothetical protein HPP92_014248 [Vanilla planifolia]|uniref:Uncharacterized protein n=1 Tax=Vanilla planifolia TaxID=51239 RepID=A0A835QZA7_VANPL|nr:hypothetical protein HPP92_014248 [Vanilla planifolia]